MGARGIKGLDFRMFFQGLLSSRRLGEYYYHFCQCTRILYKECLQGHLYTSTCLYAKMLLYTNDGVQTVWYGARGTKGQTSVGFLRDSYPRWPRGISISIFWYTKIVFYKTVCTQKILYTKKCMHNFCVHKLLCTIIFVYDYLCIYK